MSGINRIFYRQTGEARALPPENKIGKSLGQRITTWFKELIPRSDAKKANALPKEGMCASVAEATPRSNLVKAFDLNDGWQDNMPVAKSADFEAIDEEEMQEADTESVKDEEEELA